MKVGIVGFPSTGKTTIFNALTGLRAETGMGGKAKENTGVIKVPDERVKTLSEMHASKKEVFAEVQFVDVATPTSGHKPGTGLQSGVISAMRECDALVPVIRGFDNPMLEEPANPAKEIADFMAELILSDLSPLENRMDRLKKVSGKDTEKALIQKCIAHLENENPLSTLALDPNEETELVGFGLLSPKPLLWLLNQAEEDIAGGIPDGLSPQGGELMAMSGKIEAEIGEMDPAEGAEFLADLGIESSARDRFVQKAYGLLDLICFITTGEDETRAWPIRRGTIAHKAAGKIHSDIERGFIRAEVIAYNALVELGGEKQAREQGKLRLEGKEYVVQDGDVIEYRFNV